MDEKKSLAKSHLGATKEPIWWNWWGENPAEVVLVVFILVFFFLLPRAGCGVTQVGSGAPSQATSSAQP